MMFEITLCVRVNLVASERIRLLIYIVHVICIRKVDLNIIALIVFVRLTCHCSELRVIKLVLPMLMLLVRRGRQTERGLLMVLEEVWGGASLRQLLIYLLLVVHHGNLLL